MSQAIRRHFLEALSTLFLSGCIVPIPPHPITLSEVPTISGASCNVTIVRKKQLAGAAPRYYISLDQLVVAALDVGEYTIFPISQGRHSLAVTWRVADRIVGGGAAGAIVWSPYTRSLEVDCKPPVDYLFAIAAKGIALDERDRVELNQAEKLDGDFALDGNRYTPPGRR